MRRSARLSRSILVFLAAAGTLALGASVAPAQAHRESAGAPTASSPPVLSGAARDGSTLTVSTGSWTGSPTSYAYAWTHCDKNGNACSTAGSGFTHLVTAADIGNTLKATVSATNAAGSASAFVLSAVISGVPPANSSLPGVAGKPVFSATLAVTPGAWAGSAPQVFSYQWQSSADGTTWTGTGVVTSTYTMASSMAGRLIRVAVTASNIAGTSTAYSPAIGPIAAAPVNTAGPRLGSATPKLGDTLTATPGLWAGSPAPTFSYQWQSSATCASWVDIAGATSASYVVARGVVSDCLRLVVTARNAAAATTASSGSTARTLAAPAIVTAPVVIAPLQVSVGTALIAVAGSWSASPNCVYTYRWQTSTDNVTWTYVNAAVGSHFTVSTPYRGRFLRIAVTASNSLGSFTAYSAALSVTS